MQPKIVISLTTFPKRMDTIHLVIKSLLAMRPCPDKVVLYLSEPEFPDKKLPLNLTEMQSGIFEIRFTKHNYKSFNKLIHALRDFPESIIITVDDDIIYPSHMLRQLLAAHKKYPTDICANRIRELNISDNTIQPYTTWRLSERRKLFRPSSTSRIHKCTNGCWWRIIPGAFFTPRRLGHKKVHKIMRTPR